MGELAARIKATYAEYHRAAGNERLSTEVLGLGWRGWNRCRQARPAAPLGSPDAIRAQPGTDRACALELIALDGEKAADPAPGSMPLLAPRQRRALADPLALRPVPPVTTADATRRWPNAPGRTRNPA